MNGFMRSIAWRLAAVEARAPQPGDTALLAALAEEVRADARWLGRETAEGLRARIDAAAARPLPRLVQLPLWDERRAAA